MVDLMLLAPILPALRSKDPTGKYFHDFKDLNAKEKA
jgi:hypothetical protein|tara:strand:+ start:394 stop:504 length:111 start_codon:yes stop_codon:yes gene_type:complete